jgi:hypothetical protein
VRGRPTVSRVLLPSTRLKIECRRACKAPTIPEQSFRITRDLSTLGRSDLRLTDGSKRYRFIVDAIERGPREFKAGLEV